jgi:hypothetical protein
METQKLTHREKLFETLSSAIEKIGNDDPKYSNNQKSEDILDVLENLLAYTIILRSNDPDEVRDSCESAYVSLKQRAVIMYKSTHPEK